MKNISFIILFISLSAFSQDAIVKDAEKCKNEVQEKCKGMTSIECREKKLISDKCLQQFGTLENLGKSVLSSCPSMFKLCPVNVDSLNMKNALAAMKKHQDCVAKNKKKFSKKCQNKMDSLAPGGKERKQYESLLKN